jgi:hypothetical protein
MVRYGYQAALGEIADWLRRRYDDLRTSEARWSINRSLTFWNDCLATDGAEVAGALEAAASSLKERLP